MQTLLLKAAKKGEGSRGGKIIGHTKGSGKPIYAATSKRYSWNGADHTDGKDMAAFAIKHHPDYSAEDHSDASEAHAKAANAIDEGGFSPHGGADSPRGIASMGRYIRHKSLALAHHAAAAAMGSRPSMGQTTIKVKDVGTSSKRKNLKNSMAHIFAEDGLSKSLDALHPSDGLHQMGAQFAQKHPDMSASQHMAESSKFAKTGQPHMAIGHMMAASFKSSVAKKSMAAEVLEEYLGKSSSGGKSLGFTGGHEVFSSTHPDYRSGHFKERPRSELGHKQRATSAMKHVIAKFPKMTSQDHANAANLHHHNYSGGTSSALVSQAHGMAAAHLAKLGKSLSANVLMEYLSKAASKGEGSRGGKIIGHTKGNRPIYASGHNDYQQPIRVRAINQGSPINLLNGHLQGNVKAAHHIIGRRRDMSSQDHLDAAEAHKAHAQKQHALYQKIFNAKSSIRQPGDDPDVIASSGPHSHLKQSAQGKAFAAIHSAQESEKASSLHAHAAKVLKRHEKKDSGETKKSEHGVFNDLLKASGITMWAPKPDRAELARLN